MKRLIYILIPILSVLYSCGNSYILDPDTLEDVLVDVHLAEGLMLQNSHKFTSPQQKVDLFNSVYNKYGIDKARLDSTMIYYSDDPTLLSEVYEKVYDRIEKIAKTVETGQYTLSKTNYIRKDYEMLFLQDKALLPNIKSEFWSGKASYNFKKNEFETFSNSLEPDSIQGDIVLRFTMLADSLESASCNILMSYKDDSTEQSFDLPLQKQGMVEVKWTSDKEIEKLRLNISAKKLNKNAECEISDFRIYALSPEKHDIKIF